MNKFDRIIQEDVQPLTPAMIRWIQLLEEDAEVTLLPRKMQRTLEREADVLLRVRWKDGQQCIYHIEWQTSNEPRMPARMLLHHALLFDKYNLPVRGVVIYTGSRKINMPTAIQHGSLSFGYRLIDLADYSADKLLQSDIPDELIISILAGRPSREEARLQVRKILSKLHTLLGNDPSELSRRIVQLEVLSELKGFQDIIIEEEKNMAFILDDSKSIRFQQGLKQGLEKGIEKGLSKATEERNTAFVNYLLLNTSHSPEEIAQLVNVPIDFVLQVKAAHSKS